MQLKNLFIVFIFTYFFCLNPFQIKGQTYISPVIGIGTLDAPSYVELFSWGQFYQAEKWNNHYYIFGIEIEKMLSKKMSLALSTNYSKLHFDVFDSGVVGYNNLKLDNWRIMVNANYRIWKNLETSFGLNYNLQTKGKVGTTNYRISYDDYYNLKQYGFNASCSYNFKNFNLKLRYVNASPFNRIERFQIQNYSHFECLLLYRFKFKK